MGWLSRIEQPWVCGACIALWRLFSDLDLSEAKETRFKSLHDCFTRELKEGARPIDPDPGAARQSLRRTGRRLRQGGARGGVAGQGLSIPARWICWATRSWRATTRAASTRRCG